MFETSSSLGHNRKESRTLRIVVADDHVLVREGLILLINAQPDMEVVGEAGEGEDAWRVVRELLPDVVVLDVAMPGLNGAQTAERLRTACPGVKVLALSAHSDYAHVSALLAAGASGYVLKRAASAELANAIREVASGGSYFDEALPVECLTLGDNLHDAAVAPLSSREVEVIKLVAWGHSNKDIAARLFLSVKTVEGYKARIMEKLCLASRVDLVRFAMQRGWMEEEI